MQDKLFYSAADTTSTDVKQPKRPGIPKWITTTLLILVAFSLIQIFVSEKKEEKVSIDVSNIAVELGDYHLTSLPIGVGNYDFEQSIFGKDMIFSFVVRKNSNSPWCGAITAEIEFLDEQNHSIGAGIAKSDSLRKDMGDVLEFHLQAEDGKLVYNRKSIAKIVLRNIYEEDDIHRFLKSNFQNKERELQNCIDENNYEMFYSKLQAVREEYPREEYPDENATLDQMENTVHNATDTEYSAEVSMEPDASDDPLDLEADMPTTPSAPPSNTPSTAEAFKQSCTWLAEADRGILLRYPDEYLGERVATSGRIEQFIPVTYSGVDKIMQSLGIARNEYPYAMAIDGGDGSEDCRYIIFYNDKGSGAKMLTGDIVTVYGVYSGNNLMEMTAGSDYFPVIKAKYIEF